MNPEWPLILFTFFLCLSGGILGAQGLLTVLGKGKKMQNVALIAALATLVIGGICVFMHLQHWERIFNAFGALLAGNGYGVSGITLELWGCVVEFIAIALFFLFARRAEDGVAPKWAGILAIIVGLALPMVTGDSYLMPSLPTWDTPLLIVYYLTNTIFMGGLAALVIAGLTGDIEARDFMVKTALVGAVAQLVIVLVYAIVINGSAATYSADIAFYFDPTLPDVPMVDRAGRRRQPAGRLQRRDVLAGRHHRRHRRPGSHPVARQGQGWPAAGHLRRRVQACAASPRHHLARAPVLGSDAHLRLF